MEQRFISMDNEKDIKLSGKITIEETKEYAYSKIKNFCVELTSGGCKIDQFYKNGQNWRQWLGRFMIEKTHDICKSKKGEFALVSKEDRKSMDLYIGYRLCEVGPFQNLINKKLRNAPACLQL